MHFYIKIEDQVGATTKKNTQKQNPSLARSAGHNSSWIPANAHSAPNQPPARFSRTAFNAVQIQTPFNAFEIETPAATPLHYKSNVLYNHEAPLLHHWTPQIKCHSLQHHNEQYNDTAHLWQHCSLKLRTAHTGDQEWSTSTTDSSPSMS